MEQTQRRWWREAAKVEKRSCRGDDGEAQRKWRRAWAQRAGQSRAPQLAVARSLLCMIQLPVHSSPSHTSPTAFCQPLRCGASHAVRRSARRLLSHVQEPPKAPLPRTYLAARKQCRRTGAAIPLRTSNMQDLSEPKQTGITPLWILEKSLEIGRTSCWFFQLQPVPAHSSSLIGGCPHLGRGPKRLPALAGKSPCECLRWPSGAW